MSIQIKEAIFLAKEQTIKFERLRIEKDTEYGRLTAFITFSILNEKGERVGQKDLDYSGQEFNTFWSGFTSGRFLFEEVVRKENINIEVPQTVENDFINTETPTTEE